MNRLLPLLTAFSLASGITIAAAANLQFLKHDPARHFTEQDWQLEEDTFRQAMADNEDGVAAEWRNPANSNTGSITPLSRFQDPQGNPCRKVRIYHQSSDMESSRTFDFCRDGEGKWRFAPRPKKAAK